MPPLSLVKTFNDAYCPSYLPVVVVFGGTSGIGKAMTRRLAEQLNGRVHIIVVGRNKAAADKLFDSLPTPSSQDSSEQAGSVQPTYEFIYCELTVMANVHQACSEISSRCGRINYLVLTSGTAYIGARQETAEGIDNELLALRFYWKFAVINDLLPKLRAAKEQGEAAGVFVVLGMGNGPKIDFSDLGVKKYHRWGIGPLFQGVSYGDLALSMYAEREPDIAFTHMFPGMVKTEGSDPSATSNPIVKFLLWVFQPLMVLLFIRVDVSAEHMVYGLLGGERGFWQRNTVGDSVGPRNVGYSESDKAAFWRHCLETTKSVPR